MQLNPRDEALFADALALPAAQREAFLARECGADLELLRRLRVLVAAHDHPANPLAPPAASGVALAANEKPGEVIGRYKLLQKIGEGGCGVVWMAEQEEPVRRRVALKIIKLGMDTTSVVARFEAERQALAVMDHPNIAKVHDAGATETGRPFFVMELVRGITITRYCDENRLTPTARLELFIKVCQAVQHAHQKGIIHRDLKPSNILVTVNDGTPTPKVIDFGIAKATQGRLTDATVFTAFEQFIGTPVYMSPEQAEMSSLDIDTRSDIYSLGVLLYELLTGRPPFDARTLAQAGIDGIRQQIREVEPPRPSARLGTLSDAERDTVARLRGTVDSALSILLRGDLDWIVMRCMEKNRTRRYDTANGLAADIQRYLRNEPVVARPPSTWYLLQKLFRRHRVGFTAGAAVACAVILGGIFSTWQAVRAIRAEKEQTTLREAAERAGATEWALRREAQSHELAARRMLYAADMNLAQQALHTNNLGRVRRLLDRHRPANASTPDVRGWEWRYLWQQSRSEALAKLMQHDEGAFTVSYSPDGRLLAVGCYGGRVELWDAESRRLVRVLHEKGAAIGKAVFSPRENALVATAETGVLMWHDLASGRSEQLARFKGNIRNLSFSHDGARVVVLTASPGPAVHVLDPGRKGILSELPLGATSGAHWHCARLSSDYDRLYYNDWVGPARKSVVRMRQQSTGKIVWEAGSGTDVGFTAMELSPDGRFLVTGTGYQDGRVTVRNALTGEVVAELQGHTRWIPWLTFSRDGRWLASASSDQTIRLWDTATWKEAGVFRGHGDEVHAVAFSPDGAFLASGSKEGSVMLWKTSDAAKANAGAVLPPQFRVAWPLPGGNTAIALRTDSHWSIVDLRTQRETPLGFDPAHSHFLVPPNILGSYDRVGRLAVHELHSHGPTLLAEIEVGGGYGGVFAYCREAKLVAWGDGSASIHVASLARPGPPRDLTAGQPKAVPVGFSADGRFLRVRHGRDFLTWDLSTGRVQDSPTPDYMTADARSAQFGLDSRALLAPALQQYRPRGNLSAQALSPDRATLAIAAESGLVAVYDNADHSRFTVLQGHMGAVHGLAFSPDAKRLVTTCGAGEAVKLWDLETRQELLTLSGFASLITVATFSDDGNTLLIASPAQPGSCQYWTAPSWAEIERAEKSEAATAKL
ncbi:MAG TPA: protein kinase [Opitutaceae bacterium]|nr:protein kinase [Opitutaceae bacterium]